MRKILYSPGYGAGWTSWCGNVAVKKIMLEYKPIIEALERGESMYNSSTSGRTDLSAFHPAIRQMCQEIEEKFGEDKIPYLGGAEDLKVKEVPDGCLVRINEYDGYESVEIMGDYQGWL